MQYRSKEVVEAIQYTGENEEEILAFIKKHDKDYWSWEIEKHWDSGITFVARMPFFHEIAIGNGDYIVKFKIVRMMYKADFETRYTVPTPFPKETTNAIEDIRNIALTEPSETKEKLLDALETIKQALSVKK